MALELQVKVPRPASLLLKMSCADPVVANQGTARMKWAKEMYIFVTECFYSAEPFDENSIPIRECRQRLQWEFATRPELSEKNYRLSEVELEAITRRLGEQGKEAQQEVNGINHTEEILARLNVDVEENKVHEAEIAIEVNKTAEITPEEQLIADEVKRLMTQGESSDNIMFKKVQKKLNEETR